MIFLNVFEDLLHGWPLGSVYVRVMRCVWGRVVMVCVGVGCEGVWGGGLWWYVWEAGCEGVCELWGVCGGGLWGCVTYFDITLSWSNSLSVEVLPGFFLCCRFFFRFFFTPSPTSCVSELCESIRATFRLGRTSSVCVCVCGVCGSYLHAIIQ